LEDFCLISLVTLVVHHKLIFFFWGGAQRKNVYNTDIAVASEQLAQNKGESFSSTKSAKIFQMKKIR